MSYSDFTLRRVKEELGLTLVEGGRFLPPIPPCKPSSSVSEYLQESVPLAIAMGSEKARSELIISPILFELRRQCDRKISFFSGEEFNVDASLGLTGVCDFLVSRSTEQLLVEAPTVMMVEAKKENIKGGLGQCMAEMFAAQKFNQSKGKPIDTIYGCVTSGNLWTLLKLENTTVFIDQTDYLVPPIDTLLGILVWMAIEG